MGSESKSKFASQFEELLDMSFERTQAAIQKKGDPDLAKLAHQGVKVHVSGGNLACKLYKIGMELKGFPKPKMLDLQIDTK